MERRARGQNRDIRLRRGAEMFDDLAGERQRVVVIVGEIVGNAGKPRMRIAAAERFRIDHLARRLFHQRRAGKEDGALFFTMIVWSHMAGT